MVNNVKEKILVDLIAVSEDAKTFNSSSKWKPFKETDFEHIVTRLNSGYYNDTKEVRSVYRRYELLKSNYDIEWRRSRVVLYDFNLQNLVKIKKKNEIGLTLLECVVLRKFPIERSLELEGSDKSLESVFSVFHDNAIQVGFIAGVLIHHMNGSDPHEDERLMQELINEKRMILNKLRIHDEYVKNENILAAELLGLGYQFQRHSVFDKDAVISKTFDNMLQSYGGTK